MAVPFLRGCLGGHPTPCPRHGLRRGTATSLQQGPGQPQRNITRGLFIGALYLSAFLVLIAAIWLAASHNEVTLYGSTFFLAGYIALTTLVSQVWEKLPSSTAESEDPPKAPDSFDLSPSLTQATNLYITIEGVVLGLIFTFVQGTSKLTLTVKVGAAALAVGLLVGLLLYSLVAVEVKGDGPTVVAGFLFNVMSWLLAYGLLCIVSSLVFQR
jgi:hypothetical protein